MTTRKNGQPIIDMKGRRFGRLVVVEQDLVTPNQHHIRWQCLCDCGKPHSADGVKLRSGETRSCGCYRADVSRARKTIHGHAARHSTTKIYMVWHAMVSRCHSPTNKDYQQYGGRGIAVCDDWKESFPNFLSDMGEPGNGMTLERGDVNGGYCKINCYWASRRDQARNTRKTLRIGDRALIDVCEELGIKHKTVLARIKSGLSPEMALRTNMRQYKCQLRKAEYAGWPKSA